MSTREFSVVVGLLLFLPDLSLAGITGITGNKIGIPSLVLKVPCPRHGTVGCWSQLVPIEVTLIADPTDWFKTTLGAEYQGDDWNFHYLGGNDNMNGTFHVEYYRAYNDCPDFMGAEIEVSFVPDPGGSLIDDVLWIQTYRETWPGHDASAVDDRNQRTRPGALPGPFYPYQDEDEDAPRWQSSYQYDYFYDKPGDPCPTPGTITSLRFETYATWWDDYFNADGSITDVGGDGHHVFIHEGFRWGYDLHCIPDPASATLAVLGVFVVGGLRQRRALG
ncbi:MAG TPA: hypothetical protein PKZ07_16435 [Sedimentisphaerales bacterium]|nr:hypothetical protein [Sedimentisphaerales bacterium]